jgi:predicted RNase H-like HicB family nuclease
VKEKQITLEAQIHWEEGMYWAEVTDHPGLFASGETLDELTEALIEAWLLYTQDSIASSHIESLSSRDKKKRSQASTGRPSEQVSGKVDQLRLLVPA